MTDSAKVRSLIGKRGLKLSYVAEMLGISSYSLALKIDNKNEFKSSEVSAMCDLLNINDLQVKEDIFFAKEVDLKSTIQQ